MKQNTLKLRLKSLDCKMLDQSCERIVIAAKMTKIIGPIVLPVIGEPRVYKRMIEFINPASSLIEKLMHLELPYGVEIAIKQDSAD